MQVTIDIPDSLAKALESETEHVAEVIQRGLAQSVATESAVAQEIIRFLGRGPAPREIIDIRLSDDALKRASELLEKNRESALTPEERTEIDEICAWNRTFALIKAQARLNLETTS